MKTAFITIIYILFSWMIISQEPQDPIREKVDVTVVEVPVRVYCKGKLVTDLGREEFTLYENGKERPLSDFFLVKKKILLPEQTAAQSPAHPSRYFALIFRAYDFNEALQQGLDTLFNQVLRDTDQIVVFINDKTLSFPLLADKRLVHDQIETVLRQTCHEARSNMMAYLKQVEQMGKGLKSDLLADTRNNSKPSTIEFALKQYTDLWKSYKQRYLAQNLESYYRFADHLSRIKKEKWAINFYQIEMVPKISLGKELRKVLEDHISGFRLSVKPEDNVAARTISQQLQLLDREWQVCADFPSEEAAKLFYKVNTTFHTILMKSHLDSLNEDFEFQQIASNIENSLRALTNLTGGELLSSNDTTESLQKIVEVEDSYYMLAYVPKNKNKPEKIRIKVDRKDHEVAYDNNQRADYITEYLDAREKENPTIRYQDLSFKQKKLHLVIGNFKTITQDGRQIGRLNVHIEIKTKEGQEVFNTAKQIDTIKNPITISLDFSYLSPGSYNILVTTQDLISGKTCTDILQPTLPN